jgi:hypothetical protein
MVAGVGRVEIRRDVRLAIELPQRQPDQPDASKSKPGFFTKRASRAGLPPFSGGKAGTVTVSIAGID